MTVKDRCDTFQVLIMWILNVPQVLETLSCYPENMEAKELRRILTQPHFMVGFYRNAPNILLNMPST